VLAVALPLYGPCITAHLLEKAVTLALTFILALLMSSIILAVCSVAHLWHHLALKPLHLQSRGVAPQFWTDHVLH
jgi:hypothetical protein